MGPIHFVRKLLMFCLNGLYFWLGPIYKLFKSHVNYALMWILRILGPIKFCKGPIKILNGPLKFGNLHVFELDMGPGTTLGGDVSEIFAFSAPLHLGNLEKRSDFAFKLQEIFTLAC